MTGAGVLEDVDDEVVPVRMSEAVRGGSSEEVSPEVFEEMPPLSLLVGMAESLVDPADV